MMLLFLFCVLVLPQFNDISIKKSSVVANQLILTVEEQIIPPHAANGQGHTGVPPNPIHFTQLDSCVWMLALEMQNGATRLLIAVIGG